MALLNAGIIRRRWKLLLPVLLVLGYGLSGGCYAQQLPPALAPQETALIARAPLPYRVIVVPWDSVAAARHRQNAEAYASSTLRWLKSSGAFASVRLGSPGDTAADFAASPTGAYCNTAVIPMFTILSLGVIPTIFNDTECRGAVLHPLHPASGRPDSVPVSSQLSGRVVMGWLAVAVGALPGWTHGEASKHRRGREHARLEILLHRSRLMALTGAGAQETMAP